MTLYDARLLMAVERERNGTRASWLAEEAALGFPEHRYSYYARGKKSGTDLAAKCMQNELRRMRDDYSGVL